MYLCFEMWVGCRLDVQDTVRINGTNTARGRLEEEVSQSSLGGDMDQVQRFIERTKGELTK